MFSTVERAPGNWAIFIVGPCTGQAISRFNPFTLTLPLESIVCYFHTFENNLWIKLRVTIKLKGSCSLTSLSNIFPSNIFQKRLLLDRYFQNCQACFGRSECEWVNRLDTTYRPDVSKSSSRNAFCACWCATYSVINCKL